jgi:hypothetical protein
MDVTGEVEDIVAAARAFEARVVGLGPLVFFSSTVGDAWVLDPVNGVARCLALHGKTLPSGILEGAKRFTVEWQAVYRLAGEFFTVGYRDGRVQSIGGYPIDGIREVIGKLRPG